MRRFNVTGVCTPKEDYMVDISGKLRQIKVLVDDRCYFTINRPRQYGKTTVLSELEKYLSGEYTVVSLSFQGLGDESFANSEAFCQAFINLVVHALQFTNATTDYIDAWDDSSVTGMLKLSRHITKMCKDRKIVLFIDEVDRTSNNRVFLHFIDMLREKFLARRLEKDFTFHSVIFAGVYDIKNIKLKMMNEGIYTPTPTEGKIYNSPWNIAADFQVDMSFNADEIATMLSDYEQDHHTGMGIGEIAEALYDFTNGYPFLVSRMCKCIDETMDKEWTPGNIQEAARILIAEKNTLFDDLFKNLENNKDLYSLIYDILIIGEKRLFNKDNPTISLGFMYGIIKEKERYIHISNRIFEIRICDYFISNDKEKRPQKINGVLQQDVINNGRFNMELCLRKFAEHYTEIYTDKNERDKVFFERHGRMLFLSYLKPLINGQGFYHIESQFTDLRRMDIVVDFRPQQFIIELKLWDGKTHQADAYAQLDGYLEGKGADTGYLLTFDFRKDGNKAQKAEWVEFNGRRIFDVVV